MRAGIAASVLAAWKQEASVSAVARKLALSRSTVYDVLYNNQVIPSPYRAIECPECRAPFFPPNRKVVCCSTSCAARHRKKPRCRFITTSETTQIVLPTGEVALIDTADLPLVRNIAWFAQPGKTTVYVAAAVRQGTGPQRNIQLHRFLLGFPQSDVDHRDCDGLNNRRRNLRLATDSQNLANARKTTRNTSSRFKGVSFGKSLTQRRWQANIRKDRKLIYLGLFDTEEDAAHAYDAAALIHFGEFARLNFPNGNGDA